MAPWQVLRAGKATQAALGYRVHHGPGGLVHYSTAPAAAAAAAAAAVAPDSSSRSFCLSREKVTMQQLNRRLASYLQQVQCLEAANQKLESQIQKELDKKCPGELRHLDGHLRTVSLLQEQMSDCLSAQAQVKLQLLSAELTVFDLNIRYEKERERRGCLEAELSDLRLLEEELCVHRLPELQSLLMEQTQELNELQIEHQQNMQGLLADMSGGVTVEMQPAESSDLIQQLDDLRQTSVTLLDKNQDECWFNAQVSMLNSPEVTFGPPAGSEVIQAELEEVRRRAASLEEELTHLKSTNMVLEASGREQNESFVQQLVVLQQRADSLCNDLDSVLQAAAQQAAEYQNLLDIKTRLETEIQDYMKLLDGLSPQGVSSLQFKSAANITSSCVTTSPSTFRRNITGSETAGLQGGNFRMMEVQDISRGHIRTVGKTPIVAPLSQTVTTVQSVRVQQRKHAKTSPVTSINSSNVTSSFHKSEKQRTVVPPEMTTKGSMPLSETVNRQGTEFHTEDCDLKNSSVVGTQSSQGLDKGVVVKASKLETNTAKRTTMLVSAVEMKPETFTSKQTEAALQTNKMETKIQTVITKTIPCVEQDMKQGPNFGTHTTTIDPSKCIATERKKETEIVISAQLNCTEGPTQGKLQDPPQVKSLDLETQAEAIRDAGNIAITASVLSGSHILTSQEAQGKVSGDLNLFGDKDIERQEKNRKEQVDGTLTVLGLDESSTLSDASKSKQNKDTRSGLATSSSCSPDSKDNLESKTEQGIITLVPDIQPARSADGQAKPVTFTSNQTTTEAVLHTNKTEVITKTITCVEPEVKRGPNFVAQITTPDSSRQTAAEVKKETKSVILAQMNHTEGSIEGRNKDPAQIMSLSLETQAEAISDAGNKKNREEEVDGNSTVLGLDESSTLSDASKSKQNKDMEEADARSGIGITSSSSPDRNDNLNNKSAQGIITLGPETQSVMNADVQTKPETSASNQITTEPNKTETNIETVITKTITCAEPEVKQEPNFAAHMTKSDPNKQTATEVKRETEAGVQATEIETNVQTVITKTSPCVEPEVKQEPNFVAQTTAPDSSRQTAAEVKKETKSEILAQMNHTEGSIEGRNKDPAQIMSSSLETKAEAVSDAGNIGITASAVSGSHILTSQEAQGKASGDWNLFGDKDMERQKKNRKEEVDGTSTVLGLDESSTLSDASKSKQNKDMEDTDTKSSIAAPSSCSPDSKDNLESKTEQGTIILVPDTQPARSADIQAKPVTFTSNQTTTEAGLHTKKTEISIPTVITKTIPCTEPEVKQEPNFAAHMTKSDPNKQTAAEVKRETEAGVQATEIETNVQTVITKTSPCVEPEVKRGPNFVAQTTAPDSSRQTAAEVKKDAKSEILALRLDKSTDLSDASNIKQNKDMEDVNTRSGIGITSSSSPDSNDNLDNKSAQGIITLGPEKQSVMNAVVQTKPETCTSNQITTEPNKTETNIETVITKTIACAEPEVKQGPNTETVISAQINCTEGSICVKHKDPAQVVSLCLETPAEAVEDAGEVAIKASAQVKVSDNLTLMDDKDTERQEKKGEEEVVDQILSLPDVSNTKQNTDVEDAETGSGTATVSSSSPDSNDNLGSKNASTESLRKVELVKKTVNNLHHTKDVKGDPTELDNEMVILAEQEALLSTMELKKRTRQNDSGVALSSSNSEGLLSPTKDHVFPTTTETVACVNPEICLSPDETEVLMSVTDQVFCPVDLEERVLSPSDSGTCLSPVEAKVCGDEEDEEVCLSLTEANTHVRPVEKYILSTKEEGQSVSLSREQVLPEVDRNRNGSVSMRGGESLCFGSLEGNKGSRGTVNGTSNSKPTSQGISLQMSNSGMARDVAANLGTADASSSGNTDAAGIKGHFRHNSGEWKVYGGSLGQTSVSLPNTGSKESPSGATLLATSQQETGRYSNRGSGGWMVYGGSLGCKSSLPRTKSEESPSAAMLLATSPPKTSFGSRGSGVVSSSSPKHTSFLAGNDSLPKTESRESLPSALRRAISPPGTVKFGSRGSGEWKVYGGSTGRISSWAGSDNLPTADRKGNPSVATQLPVSPPGSIGAGKFGSRGSGEFRVYGGSTGRISSWAGSHNLATADREENPSVAAQLPISPPGSIGGGKFGSRGSGEFRVYGGSTGRISSWAGSHNLATADRKENPSVAAQLPISPPGSIGGGKFGSRGSGEFRVYGGSTGRISSWAGSDNLPTADRKGNPSVATQLPISPPGSIGAGRFGSGGSGEWRVYGGSSGRLSSAGNADRVSVGENRNEMVSPPSSYTSSRLRRSSSGSSGRLGSSSVIRRSSSVGSGGRLSSSGSGGKLSSSSGSNRTSTSGRFSSTASGECKPVYSSASGRKSTVGSAGRSGGGGTIGSQRAPSPGGRMSASTGSGGWLSSSAASGTCNSSSGSGSKLSSAGGSDRVSSRTGGRISSSSGSGRTNSMGGRVISSSDRPIRSTGSGAGGNKERISVCKMAALSMSAAGRERSEDRQRQAQRHQQQQAGGTSPLLQRWLSSGDEVKTATPDGLDDIMRL